MASTAKRSCSEPAPIAAACSPRRASGRMAKSQRQREQPAKHGATREAADHQLGEQPGQSRIALAATQRDGKFQRADAATLGKLHGAHPDPIAVLQGAVVADVIARELRRARQIRVAEIGRSALHRSRGCPQLEILARRLKLLLGERRLSKSARVLRRCRRRLSAQGQPRRAGEPAQAAHRDQRRSPASPKNRRPDSRPRRRRRSRAAAIRAVGRGCSSCGVPR